MQKSKNDAHQEKKKGKSFDESKNETREVLLIIVL